jgi:ABC-type spermidine/putrescine transport system permease subunit II
MGRFATVRKNLLMLWLLAFFVFLYLPILTIAYTSFSEDVVWPFPPSFTLDGYLDLLGARAYREALMNSLLVGLGSAVLATVFALPAAFAVLRYPTRTRVLAVIVFVSPLFVAELLVGIATLVFNKQLLGLSGSLWGAMFGNAVHGFAFAFLILVAQLLRHNWALEEAAKVFGATPLRVFWEITLPAIWPALMGAFLTSFLLAFNNLDISFYNLGAIPVLPTLSWGSLRYGLKPELFSLSTLVNAMIFLMFIVMVVVVHVRKRRENA